ncbi:MAG: extracellular solute-binding protein [Chloroflexi bacterium]|nr:extracellular solute-binding protein [Chloroflexota bacterium]
MSRDVLRGRLWLRVIWLSLGLALAAWTVGCNAANTPVQPATASPRPPTRTPPPTRPDAPAAQPTIAVTTTSGIISLTWWTPEFISPKASAPAGPLLAKLLADFEAAQDGKIRVTPVLKAKYGKGGLLDFLLAARSVAPTVLPDVVILDVAELEPAAGAGVLQPLDNLLTPEVVNGLYPFARQAGQFGGRLLAVQYVADLDHVIYNRGRLTSLPSTWAGLLAGKVIYVFPASSPQPRSGAVPFDDVQHSVLSQYLSAGGLIDPKTRHLALQEQPLLLTLSYYSDALQANLLPPEVLEASSLDDAWSLYVQGQAHAANVSARRYLAGRESLPDAAFAPAPGWSNPAPPITSGWALAVVAADPARQKAAAAFINWLLAPENAGGWAQAAGWLPTAPKALAVWGANPYREFLDRQLASAVSHPIGADYPQVAGRLQKAVTSVLRGASSPNDAAQAALK